MNAIYTNQSTRENLDLLYAQARVYDRVKNWNRLNFLFSIIVPLLLSFVTVYNRSREFVDSELLSSLLGLYGLLVLTFNVTNGAIVIHTQRLKSDPGGNLLS
ncbi:TPA: S-4TM family putative pore-forming effector [Escherichia coli]|uniref:S-4TM family putative pore-forming effector n=1 Tax=Escherichia coli TaxID=562 RepID=UPI0024A6C8D7|nr:S-4TM family putative pore-forming effector [Escherichia coli]MCV0639191.1 S-4TM family putative pore-forming effector [Escherichia coli]MDO2625011.1 S-4TM family putative pore-forming effector [Escherichia coli]MDO2797201.1 S-4TM family putative pore-forming effector [Escherichia coli]MEC6522873.1 S-4TM family putative pore-forming effector [Escherichia coli]MEC6549530.1 S-4TM family putative pore-forming effector [Escherichia coli]